MAILSEEETRRSRRKENGQGKEGERNGGKEWGSVLILQHWVTLFYFSIFQTTIKTMAAEFVVNCSKKRRVEEPEFPTNRCVICGAQFSAKNPATTPDQTKLQSLLTACSERKDEVGLILLAKQSSILDGSVTIRHHRHCRSTYTSKLHLKRNAD